jgi:adenylate cyclase
MLDSPVNNPLDGKDSFTVLIVDDQEDIRLLVSHYLGELGVHVEEASSGAGACARVAASGIDLVILDIGLPDISGLKVCKHIRAAPATALLPIIMVTGLNSRDDRLAGFRAGASDFLSKPIDREELLVRSRTLLDLHATRRALEEARAQKFKRQSAALRSTLKRYMSPAVADLVLAGERVPSKRCAEVAVLFADLRGFTRMSEMLDPADLVKLLNEFFERMTLIVHRCGGAVFHFAGDALMAGFGVSEARSDAAANALHCGRQMIAECQPLFARWPVTVGLGVGINCGEVIAGDIGSADFMTYTLIGDTVNIASRLTARARAGEVLMSATVVTAARRSGQVLETTALPPLHVRGKQLPVEAHCITVVGRSAWATAADRADRASEP